MIDFALYSNKQLKEFITNTDFKGLQDQELIYLNYELVQVPSRKPIHIPESLLKEMKARKIDID